MVRDTFIPRCRRALGGSMLACWLSASVLGAGERLAWGETTPSAQQLWDWYGEASRLHDEGKVNEAWNLYKKIWKYRRTYDVAASMGEICARRAQFALAARYYRHAIETVAPTQTPEFIKAVNDEYSKVRREVTELALTTTPKVASLRVFDDTNDVELELPLFLEVGQHRLRAEAPGYGAVTKTFTAEPGALIEWDLVLPPLDHSPSDTSTTNRARHPALVFGVGGALTLGLGAGAYLMGKKANDQYRDGEQAGLALPPGGCAGRETAECSDLTRAYSRAESTERTALALAGGAGLAAIATIVVYLVWEDEQEMPVTLERTADDGWKVGYGLAF